jgi:hypothetical protein
VGLTATVLGEGTGGVRPSISSCASMGSAPWRFSHLAMCSDMAATIIIKNKQEQKHKKKKIQCTVQKEDSDRQTKKKELFKCLCINAGNNLIMGELQT